MTETNWRSVEEMEMFRRLERLTDEIWTAVLRWGTLPRDTVGKQLVRASDSIGANLCEGDARFHHRDKLNYCYIARASLKETAYWIRRAKERGLLSQEAASEMLAELESIRRWINTLITERRKWLSEVHEEPATYMAE